MPQQRTHIIRFVDVNIPVGEELVDFLSIIRVRVRVRVCPQNPNAIHTTVAAHHTLAWSLPTCLEVTVKCGVDERWYIHYCARLCTHHTIVNGIHGLKGSPLLA